MPTVRLKVTGMTCAHCVAAVTKALEKVPGVDSAEVSLEQERAAVKGAADPQALIKAIQEEGFEAELQS